MRRVPKLVLSALVALSVALGVAPATVLAESDANCPGDDSCTHVAAIGNTHYDTLAEAVAAVHEQNAVERMENTTILLLRDAVGGGIGAGYECIEDGTTKGNNPVCFTLDLNDHTYTVNSPTVGSSGTETNGLQLLQGSKVTILNGVVRSDLSGNILIQNYCDLTLDDVKLEAPNAAYVLSDNCGKINIKGNTSITAGTGKVAFDVCGYTIYPGVSVTVATTGTIAGTIEITRSKGNTGDVTLNITSGTFVGWIDNKDDQSQVTITGGDFSSDVSEYVPDGYKCTKGEDVYKVAQIGEAELVVKPDESANDTTSATLDGTFVSSTTNEVSTAGDGGSGKPSGAVSGNNVTIKLPEKQEATTASLNMTADTVASLATGNATLTISSNVGTMEVSSEALKAIAKQSTNDITLSIKKEDSSQGGSLDFSLIAVDAEDKEVFSSTTAEAIITVTVSAPSAAKNGDTVYVYYVDASGNRSLEASPTVSDGKVTWDVTHFSKRVLTTEQDEVTYTKDGETVTGTLAEAVQNADASSTIYLNRDITVEITDSGLGAGNGAITINRSLTIDGGEGHYSISAGDGFEMVTLWNTTPAGKYHVINIMGGDVTLKNLTIDGGWDEAEDVSGNQPATNATCARSGINTWTGDAPGTVTLKNVAVNNCSTYAVTIGTGFAMNATNLTTSGSRWGINVDGDSKLTIGGDQTNIAEESSIVYESEGDENGALTVNGGTYQNVVVQVSGKDKAVAGTVTLNGGSYSGSLDDEENRQGGIVYSVANMPQTSGADTALQGKVIVNGGTYPTTSAALINGLIDSSSSEFDTETGEVKPAENSVAAINGVGYTSLDDAVQNAVSGQTVRILTKADQNLGKAVGDGVTLVIDDGQTVNITDLMTVVGSEGKIRVQANGALTVAGDKMIGSDGNIVLTAGYVDLSKTGSLGSDLALALSFVRATVEVPTGCRWTTVKNVSTGQVTVQVPMNVTLDENTTLTVNGSKNDNTGFHVANGSTLTNKGTIEVNTSMSIGSSGTVAGNGTVIVNSDAVLTIDNNKSESKTGALDNGVTNKGTFVWNGDGATSLKGTITLAPGGKVYSNADISNKLAGNFRVASNMSYEGSPYACAWEYYVAPSGGGSVATTYTVTVADAENGKVVVDPTTAAEGEKVTVTATPAEGHEVASVAVTCGDEKVDVTDNGDGTYAFAMPAGNVTVTVTFQASAPAVELPFTDVAEGSWYRGAVAFVYARGLMTGYEGTTLFGPEDALGREQAAAVLHRALGAGEHAGDCGLADVVQSEWYAQAVNWAVETGLITGYGDGSGLFGVGDALTRDQFAAIVARVAKADLTQADPSALDGFSDGDEVAEWAVPAVSWAVEAGILEGSPDGDGGTELRASAQITRGEMAAMVMRAAEAGLLPTA